MDKEARVDAAERARESLRSPKRIPEERKPAERQPAMSSHQLFEAFKAWTEVVDPSLLADPVAFGAYLSGWHDGRRAAKEGR